MMKKQVIQEIDTNEEFLNHFNAHNDNQRLTITRNKDIFCLDTWIVYLYYGQGKKEVFGIPFQEDLGRLFRKIAYKKDESLYKYQISESFLKGKKLPLSKDETIQCIEDGNRTKGYRNWYLKWKKGNVARSYRIAARSLDNLVTTIARDSEA